MVTASTLPHSSDAPWTRNLRAVGASPRQHSGHESLAHAGPVPFGIIITRVRFSRLMLPHGRKSCASDLRFGRESCGHGQGEDAKS